MSDSDTPNIDTTSIRQKWQAAIPDPKTFETGDPSLTYKAPLEPGAVLIPDQPPAPTTHRANLNLHPRKVDTSSTTREAITPSKSASDPGSASGTGSRATIDDGFTLLEKVGEGGMGVVWLAEQGSLRREVAVKRIKGADDESAMRQFVAEALVTGFLDHPNIVPVHALGQGRDGRLFIAMKLARGTSWKKLLHPPGEPLAPAKDLERHLRILMAVCNAVAFAHSKHIIHRDLKPENVMIGDFGEILVMDWGIAVEIAETPGGTPRTLHKSAVASAGGTPAYMSPEMAEGNGSLLGVWTDVYLLGSILHEILTGRPPHAHRASLMGALIAAMKSDPPAFDKSVPEELATIARKALAKDPAKRFQTAAAFQSAIENFLTHRESTAITEKADAESRVLMKPTAAMLANYRDLYERHAKVVARYEQAIELWDGNAAARAGVRTARLAFAAAALRVGDIGLAEAQLNRVPDDDANGKNLRQRAAEARAALDQKEQSARRTANTLKAATAAIILGLAIGFVWIRSEQQAAERERQQAVESEKRARDAALRADLNAARATVQTELAEINASRARAEATRADSEARAAKIELAKGIAKQGDALLASARPHEAADRYRDAIHRLEKLKAPTFDALLGLWDAQRRASAPVYFMHGHEGPVFNAAFLPDGLRAVTASQDGTLKLWDTLTGNELRTFTGNLVPMYVAVSADGRRMVSGDGDESARVWDIESGKILHTLSGHDGRVVHAAINRDGTRILTASADETAKLWDGTTGKLLRTLEEHDDEVVGVDISPDGRKLLTASLDEYAQIWDAETGKPTVTLEDHDGAVTRARFSSDGKWVVTAGADRTVKTWDAATGVDQITFNGHTDTVTDVLFTAGDRYIVSASADKTIRVWDTASGRPLAVYYAHHRIANISVSPDSRLLLAAGETNEASLWNLGNSASIQYWTGHSAPVTSAAFSPHGHLALTGSNDGTAALWDVPSGQVLRTFAGHDGAVTAVFNDDGFEVLTAGGKSMMLHSITKPKPLWSAGNPSNAFAAVALGEDRIVTGEADGNVGLWDRASGQFLKHLGRHDDAVSAIAIDRDGRRAFSAGADESARLWDIAAAKQLAAFHEHREAILSVAISGNGERGMTGSADMTARLWDLKNLPKTRDPRDRVVLKPDAFAEVEWEGKWYKARVLEARTERYQVHYEGWDAKWDEWVPLERIRAVQPNVALKTFSGHTGPVACVNLGEIAVTGSHDHSLKLWDTGTGEELRTLQINADFVQAFAFSNDRLLSASRDGALIYADFSAVTTDTERHEIIKEAQDVLKKMPTDGEAWKILGAAYAERGIWDRAIECMTRARKSGATIEAQQFGRCLWRNGNIAQAIPEFEKALAIERARPFIGSTDERMKMRETVRLELCLKALKDLAK